MSRIKSIVLINIFFSQVTLDIRASPLQLFIQLGESTDISYSSQPNTSVRYTNDCLLMTVLWRKTWKWAQLQRIWCSLWKTPLPNRLVIKVIDSLDISRVHATHENESDFSAETKKRTCKLGTVFFYDKIFTSKALLPTGKNSLKFM